MLCRVGSSFSTAVQGIIFCQHKIGIGLKRGKGEDGVKVAASKCVVLIGGGGMKLSAKTGRWSPSVQ